jgi:hypothetical protein
MLKKTWGKAYRTSEVGKIVNRRKDVIEKYIEEGKVPHPPRSYVIGSPERLGWHRWGDKEIVALHDYLLTIHFGRPRKDGKITPIYKTPTRKELLAMLRNESITYVKTDEGEFIPVWKESAF